MIVDEDDKNDDEGDSDDKDDIVSHFFLGRCVSFTRMFVIPNNQLFIH